jgi:hypothetical protein
MSGYVKMLKMLALLLSSLFSRFSQDLVQDVRPV